MEVPSTFKRRLKWVQFADVSPRPARRLIFRQRASFRVKYYISLSLVYHRVDIHNSLSGIHSGSWEGVRRGLPCVNLAADERAGKGTAGPTFLLLFSIPAALSLTLREVVGRMVRTMRVDSFS